MKKKNIWSLLTIILISIVCFYMVFNQKKFKDEENGVIVHDIISYYGYLPATFIYHDLSLSYVDSSETSDIVKKKTWHQEAPNGQRVFKTSMGVAIMYAPFFCIANLLSPLLGYEPNGYTLPYAFTLLLAGISALIIGLLFLRKFLLNYYSDWICAFTLFIVSLATNLLWYSTQEAPMSHVFSFCLFSIFLYLIEKWYKFQTYRDSFFMGLILGLISLVRPTNCIVVVLFLFWGIVDKNSLKLRFQLYKKNIFQLVVVIICIFIVWIPQLFYWKYLTGEWFFYSYNDNERFFFGDPRILNVLFGFRKGFFIYTPTMFLSFIGCILLWWYNKKWAFPVCLFFLLNLYVISSWWSWWYGGSFGLRAMIDSYPVMSIGLATVLTRITLEKRKLLKFTLIVLVVVTSLRTTFHTVQYYYGAIHWDSMTKKAFFHSFWHARISPGFQEKLNEPDYAAAKEGKRGE